MGEELQINIPKRAAVVLYKKTIDIIQKSSMLYKEE